MREKILEILVGAFKRNLITSEIVELDKIAKGIDHVTQAHYKDKLRDELIKFVKWYADYRDRCFDNEHINHVVDEYLKQL